MQICFLLLLAWCVSGFADGEFLAEDFRTWTQEKAVKLLNDSPWARTVTFTRVVGGVGSGVQGEKELFNTFYVRLLSAPPIRQALARIEQIQLGYDEMSDKQRTEVDLKLEPGLSMQFTHWVVIAVNFRSNDQGQENRVTRFFRTATVESLRNSAFLSTDDFARVQLAAYYPPQDDGVGARFVFPRMIEGRSIAQAGSLSFELDAPAADPDLTVNFPIKDMKLKGEVLF